MDCFMSISKIVTNVALAGLAVAGASWLAPTDAIVSIPLLQKGVAAGNWTAPKTPLSAGGMTGFFENATGQPQYFFKASLQSITPLLLGGTAGGPSFGAAGLSAPIAPADVGSISGEVFNFPLFLGQGPVYDYFGSYSNKQNGAGSFSGTITSIPLTPTQLVVVLGKLQGRFSATKGKWRGNWSVTVGITN